MITKEYAMAYREVIEILDHVQEKYLRDIPKEKIDFYRENMDDSYSFTLEEKKSFQEQRIMKITEAILANLFRDYWATPYQKERILYKEKNDRIRQEQEKRLKYNIENLFKQKENIKKDTIEEENNNIENRYPVRNKKEDFFTIIVNFFRRLFNKK